jgi:hypothetical protein
MLTIGLWLYAISVGIWFVILVVGAKRHPKIHIIGVHGKILQLILLIAIAAIFWPITCIWAYLSE